MRDVAAPAPAPAPAPAADGCMLNKQQQTWREVKGDSLPSLHQRNGIILLLKLDGQPDAHAHPGDNKVNLVAVVLEHDPPLLQEDLQHVSFLESWDDPLSSSLLVFDEHLVAVSHRTVAAIVPNSVHPLTAPPLLPKRPVDVLQSDVDHAGELQKLNLPARRSFHFNHSSALNLGNDLPEVIWCRMDALRNPAMVQQLNERMLREFPGADEGEGGPGALEHGEECVLIELLFHQRDAVPLPAELDGEVEVRAHDVGDHLL
mmetsp:Transcript_12486/g.43407  ORF Transcript_12486/g.43407 Transcript_12486/m.43407 type:complete len:260 (+) Transcript_12486:769-1548(+)